MDLCGEDGTPNSLNCMVGNNGSGKTTVLQAIALVLSAATRKNDDLGSLKHASISHLQWNGLIYERSISRSTKITLELELEPDEITTTQEVFEIWKHYYQNNAYPITKPDNLIDITFGATGFFFLLQRGDSKPYDIGEMSSGEQIIFSFCKMLKQSM